MKPGRGRFAISPAANRLRSIEEGDRLLTEEQVTRSWRVLFRWIDEVDSDTFEKAEQLIDELRPESPLRHRLGVELDELRRLTSAKTA